MCGKNSKTALIAWLAMSVMTAAASCSPDRWSLDIARVLQGEWWRLASGHLVHLNRQHLLCDLLALGLTLCLCVRLEENLPRVACTALLSACSVSLVLVVAQPVDIYGGLSGITAGLLACAAFRLLDSDTPLAGGVLIIALLAKILLERMGLSASGVYPVWQAHCAGAAAGAIVSVCSLRHDCRIISGQETGRTT